MNILVIGTFDSKREEYQFLVSEIQRLGASVTAMDIGTFSDGLGVEVDCVLAKEVLSAAGVSISEVRAAKDRGEAMKQMAEGAALKSRKLTDSGRVAGVIGMGGSGGSSVISAAMQQLPIGLPKVLLSTMAGGDTRAFVGSRDITLIPSIADISGLNRISRVMISSAAAAVVGMAEQYGKREQGAKAEKVFAVSMFGNTTECVNRCRDLLQRDRQEVLVFHATGTGGRTMEALIEDGFVDGCLDITTTEIADHVCEGILSAGPGRLAAAGQKGIPHLVVPGCVDMANFGPLDSVPERYRDSGRLLYEWNPAVTLMRTNVEENHRIGEIFVEKLNRARGPVHVLLPLRGVSILDADGERFCDREADESLFGVLREKLDPSIPLTELDLNINDSEFADAAVRLFEGMLA